MKITIFIPFYETLYEICNFMILVPFETDRTPKTVVRMMPSGVSNHILSVEVTSVCVLIE